MHENSLKDAVISGRKKPGCGILLGACGWEHAHWHGAFYPHDLPQDWSLSYYANEFSAVLLLQSQWQKNLLELEEWAFDVNDRFRFFLQCSGAESADQVLAINGLGSRFGGVVKASVNEEHTQIDVASGVALINMASQDMRGWRHWLEQHAPSLQAVFLNDASLSYQQLSDFKALLELLDV